MRTQLLDAGDLGSRVESGSSDLMRLVFDARNKTEVVGRFVPDLDSAHISFNLSRIIADGVTVGPILLGIGKPAHVLTPAATVRRIINMTAVAVVDAQAEAAQQELFAGNGVNNGKATDG